MSVDERAAVSAPGHTEGMEAWDADLHERYPESPKDQQEHHTFRDYDTPARATVKEFYRLNHINQSLDFARGKQAQYLGLQRERMSIWQAMEFLNNLVDDSDPDTDATQIEHLLQTAEGMRADGQPRWMVLTGLVHDLGKILCLWGEPQWAVVGDTYPLGCAFSDKVVYHEFFAENPDSSNPDYATPTGIYQPGCGFDNVTMSWGHDGYIAKVCEPYLPEEAVFSLRYHSFYPWHREGAYKELESEDDRRRLPTLLTFNRYDLYTKTDTRPDVAALRPFYEDLIAEYFPATVAF